MLCVPETDVNGKRAVFSRPGTACRSGLSPKGRGRQLPRQVDSSKAEWSGPDFVDTLLMCFGRDLRLELDGTHVVQS
jgi:hypothetical protein